MMPVNKNFIGHFKLQKDPAIDLIFGGISYLNEKPKKNKILRWKYGKAHEEISLKKRQKNPYTSIISGCMLIRKNLFLNVNQALLENRYGLDIFFSSLLKKRKVRIMHINNPVYHLGLENNACFFNKSMSAIDTLVYLETQKRIDSNINQIQRSYAFLKKWKLTNTFLFLSQKNLKKLKKNAFSKSPYLFLFNMYRLHYYAILKKSNHD